MPFLKMLLQIRFCENDELYILGDVIDRNPDGIRILKMIMGQPNIHLLLGNHEYMMLQLLTMDIEENRSAYLDLYSLWCFYNGGQVTYEAYLKESPETQNRILEYLRNLPIEAEVCVNGRNTLLVHASPTSLYPGPLLDMPNETSFAVWNRLSIMVP